MRILAFAFLSFMTLFTPALAQISTAIKGDVLPRQQALQPEVTTSEDIMLWFYRTADIKPDYKAWMAASEKIQKAPEYERDVLVLNEQVRLQNAFVNLDPDGFIVVHAPVALGDYISQEEALIVPQFRHGGGLSLSMYGEKVALVVRDLRQYYKIHLPRGQAGTFFKELRHVPRKSGDTQQKPNATAVMVLRPINAIPKGRSAGGLVTAADEGVFHLRIAELSLWTADRNEDFQTQLWRWRAPWYAPAQDDPELLQLYKAISGN